MDNARGRAHNNLKLFSDHFLGAVDKFPPLADQELARARELQAWLREHYRAKRPLVETGREAVTEQELVLPVLERLGFDLDPKPPLRTDSGTETPDFALFGDVPARAAAASCRGEEAYWDAALAVAEAKPWAQELGLPHAGRHPTAQARKYLAASGVRWGVLTNGRQWRLLEREASRAGLRYYEVDLPALLDADVQDFRYFYLLFRREAFAPDDQGRCYLDSVLQGSRDYWLGLTDRLKDRVYDALTSLMTGMVHGSAGVTEDDLPRVHEACLVLLYRLLFAFYSEARGLLPIENALYRRHYSVQHRRDEVCARLDAGEGFLSGSHALWTWLRELCGKIDLGDEETAIPHYDGGLFRPGEWPLLDDPAVAVPDHHLAQALERLGRDLDPDIGEKRNLDYGELTVRELGSIYEGLLELRPRYATETMIAVPGDRAPQIIPLAEADGKQRAAAQGRWEPGEVYLVTDRGERKATGSYYTPEYIVSYIVTNTLDPLLKDCAAQVAARRPEVQAEVTRREQLIAGRPEGDPENPKTLAAIEDLKLGLLEPYFQLMVLDPAMGSGHFLVAASEEITDSIITDPNHFTPAGVVDEKEENLFFKRRVVERCLYGVDLNPLAVELAKLSLWLHTVEYGKPLSFLRHHLRHGNSLIGARLGEMQSLPDPKKKSAAAPAQLNLFTSTFSREAENLLRAFNLIEHMPTDNAEQEERKEGAWVEIEARRQRFREVADLWLSVYFGNEVDNPDYALAVDALGSEEAFAALRETPSLRAARALSTQHTFFHWELEFPDAFFTEKGMKKEEQRGFDAVVGNPPWERIKLQEREFFGSRDRRIATAPTAAKRRQLVAKLAKADPDLWAEYSRAKQRADLELAWVRDSGQFPLMGRGDTNLYAVMTERGRDLLKYSGYLGFVVPSGIATDKTTSAFFGDLIATRTLSVLLDFENRRKAFPDVDSRFKFSIIVLSGGTEDNDIECGFFLHGPDEMTDRDRVFALEPSDCALMNPNTLTCPLFRTRHDAAVTRAIYRSAPILVRETDRGDENPWSVRYFTMFHMTNDSGLFRTAEELQAEGFYPVQWNCWQKGEERYLPLYVGKMVRPYDHRAACVEYHPENAFNPYVARDTTTADKVNPAVVATPQFWVPAGEVRPRLDEVRWVLAFRDIARATDERTMIAAACPLAGYGNKLPLLLRDTADGCTALLLGNLNAMALDYVVRQKLGSTSLNWFIVEQLPVLPPDRYGEDEREFIRGRVLELTYTAHDIAGFAVDMGYVGDDGKPLPPFTWDEERRLHLRSQLDALYFHLYDLDRDDAAYIMDTFPIVRRHDEQQYGRYRTKELILHYYNAYAAGDTEAWVNA